MSHIVTQLRKRLKAGGWSQTRTNRHEIWKHPNGAPYPLSTTIQGSGHGPANIEATISRLEKHGPRYRDCSEFTPELPPASDVVTKVDPPRRLHVSTYGPGHHASCTPPKPVKEEPTMTDSATIQTSPKVASAAQPKVIPWFKWVESVRLRSKLTPESVADVIPNGLLKHYTLRAIEKGTRKFSADEYAAWAVVFDIKETPIGIDLPFATSTELERRQTAITASAKRTLNMAAAKVRGGKKVAPAPKPIQAPAVDAIPAPPQGATELELVVDRARKILENPRITLAEASALVDGLRASAIEILLQQL